MAIPMLLALVTAPSLLAVQESIRQSQSKERKEEHRSRRCNLVVTCSSPSIRSKEINNQQIVLMKSKLYISTTGSAASSGHPFAGYFLAYPDSSYEGLVSSITDVAPIMNWIYVDHNTYEVKYGVRNDAQPNITGPFDCTRQDKRLTVEGWEGFVAVREEGEYGEGLWSLYYDRDDDGLRKKLGDGKVVLEVLLWRREKKAPKPTDDREKTK